MSSVETGAQEVAAPATVSGRLAVGAVLLFFVVLGGAIFLLIKLGDVDVRAPSPAASSAPAPGGAPRWSRRAPSSCIS